MSWEESSKKRRKLEDGAPSKPLDIKGSFELHNRLRFRQSVAPEVKIGINEFRTFLTNISQCEDARERQILLKVLRQYCDEQSSASKDEVDFPDLLATWNFAAQSNEEGILSAVPSVLATFLRTISEEIDFRDFGLSLCHSLLKRDQVRLMERNISAPKIKGHLITPCLRLLTEIISFDGGALAGNVFSRRDILFKRLDALLEMVFIKGNFQDNKRPSIRRMAQQLVMALLKHLDPTSRAEIISQGKTLYSCIRNLHQDAGDIVIEILQSIKKYVVDGDMPVAIKSRFLNSGNLTLFASLYSYDIGDTTQDGSFNKTQTVRDSAHSFLLHVCTSTNSILQKGTGWYPVNLNPEASELNQTSPELDLGLDSPYYSNDYTANVPVKNFTLSTFIKGLKPEQDTLQAELVTAIFHRAPELVAEYFTKKAKLLSQPKDDPIWRGQFAFLFQTIQLPVPPNLGWPQYLPSSPPPLSIVIDNIIPRPLNKTILQKCLNMNELIMTISTTRLLTVALEKLDTVSKIFESNGSSSLLWSQTMAKLNELVSERIPTLQDIVTSLQSSPAENMLLRGAILECMATYHRVLPESISESKFDIGPILINLVNQVSDNRPETEHQDEYFTQLTNVVEIAYSSPATKWGITPNGQLFSPHVALLRFCAVADNNKAFPSVEKTIKAILLEKEVLNPGENVFNALLASLRPTKKWTAERATYQFLDNCINRTIKQPIKYFEQLETIQHFRSDKCPLSLLACSVAEQWPFVAKGDDPKSIKNIAEWTARLFSGLEVADENHLVLFHLQEGMLEAVEGKSHTALEGAIERRLKKPLTLPHPGTVKDHEANSDIDIVETQAPPASAIDLDLLFDQVNDSPMSLQGLTKWDKTDFESEMNHHPDGRLYRLIRCVSSRDEEIRRQTYQLLQTIMHHLETSTYAEKQQLYLLLGEVCETMKLFGLDRPMPSITAQLSILLMQIVADPTDIMYSKANHFLLRGPSWDVSRLISYWVDKIFLSEPETDDGSQAEVGRLLDVLSRSLTNVTDMELYRKSNVFERVLSFYSSVACTPSMRRKILQLVYQGVVVGGSDTLITRISLRAWLNMVRRGVGHEIVEQLRMRLDENCNTDYINTWERGRPLLKDNSVK